jgi:hypothetical protein
MEPRSHFKLNELQVTFQIQGKNFSLFCCILHLWRKKHFVSVFYLSGQKFLIDDLNPSQPILLDQKIKDHQKYFQINISSALYYIND